MFVEGANEGALNGTTPVDMHSVPGSGVRRITRNVHFCNRDSVAHTIILSKDVGGTVYELAREELAPNEYWTFDKVTVCDATNKKLIARTLAATVTTAPSFDVMYGDAS